MRDAVADRVGGSVPVLITPHGGPEALFRLGQIEVDDSAGTAPAVAPVTVVPRIVHGGRAFTVVEAVARARDGRPCTLATVTLRAASLEGSANAGPGP